MNNRNYYTRQKMVLDDTEIKQLLHEYEYEKMNVSQIADIHKVTPGSIAYKLKKLGIIPIQSEARGYSEYQNSDLYKEIVGNTNKSKVERPNKKTLINTEKNLPSPFKTNTSEIPEIKKNLVNIQISAPTIKTYREEIAELKTDINNIKTDVKEILRLMNALYEFESQ